MEITEAEIEIITIQIVSIIINYQREASSVSPYEAYDYSSQSRSLLPCFDRPYRAIRLTCFTAVVL